MNQLAKPGNQRGLIAATHTPINHDEEPAPSSVCYLTDHLVSKGIVMQSLTTKLRAFLIVSGLCLVPTLQASCLAGSWKLAEPERETRENFSPAILIDGSEFSLEADLSLKQLSGSAASVWLGRDLNFGFDGRSGQVFAEGAHIGKTRSLGQTSEHLRKNVPFRFFARRDSEQTLEIGIGDTVLFTEENSNVSIDEFVFRPHRNTMDIFTIKITGNLRPSPAARPAVVIHRQGDHDCHTTRIPGIARTNQGTLLAVYDLRYNSRRDLQGHMDIGLSRSTDGGKTWAAPRPIMDMGKFGGLDEDLNGCSDPNILVDAVTGEILVSAVWTHGKPGTHQWSGRGSEPGLDINHSSQFMVVRSRDDGQSWSAPENWTAKLKNPEWYLFAPAPGNGITLSDGTLVMPTQGRDSNGLPFSNIICSQDRGKSWTVASHARQDTTECSVAELSDGSLMLNMRDNRNRRDKSDTNGRAVSVTANRGKTWTVHSSDHGGLPEPVCMASLISHVLQDGRRVLFFSNPNSKTQRRNMTVRVSLDDGTTWPAEKQILLDHRGGAYSSLVMVDQDTLGILYESSRANLVFQTIELTEFGLGELAR